MQEKVSLSLSEKREKKRKKGPFNHPKQKNISMCRTVSTISEMLSDQFFSRESEHTVSMITVK